MWYVEYYILRIETVTELPRQNFIFRLWILFTLEKRLLFWACFTVHQTVGVDRYFEKYNFYEVSHYLVLYNFRYIFFILYVQK